MTATEESRIYDGMSERNRSCTSGDGRFSAFLFLFHSISSQHSHLPCGVPKLQSDCAILEVHGLTEKVDSNRRLIRVVKCIVHESGDERRLADGLFPEEDELETRRGKGQMSMSAMVLSSLFLDDGQDLP